ncbi:hypothetical protein BDV3_003864 [Batrachochytrium dendrobatidis]
MTVGTRNQTTVYTLPLIKYSYIADSSLQTGFSFLNHFVPVCSHYASRSSLSEHHSKAVDKKQLYASLDTFFTGISSTSNSFNPTHARSYVEHENIKSDSNVPVLSKPSPMLLIHMRLESYAYKLLKLGHVRQNDALKKCMAKLVPIDDSAAPLSDTDAVVAALLLLTSIADISNLEQPANASKTSFFQHPFNSFDLSNAKSGSSLFDMDQNVLESPSDTIDMDGYLQTGASFDISLESNSFLGASHNFPSPFFSNLLYRSPIKSDFGVLRCSSRNGSYLQPNKLCIQRKTDLQAASAAEPHMLSDFSKEISDFLDTEHFSMEKSLTNCAEFSWEGSTISRSFSASNSLFITDFPSSLFSAQFSAHFPISLDYEISPVSVSQKFAVDCMLKATIGIPSLIFSVDPNERLMILNKSTQYDLHLTTLSSDVLKCLFLQTAEFGSQYMRFCGIITDLESNPSLYGLTGAALSVGMSNILKTVNSKVVYLQESAQNGTLHILQAISSLTSTYTNLESINSLFHSEINLPLSKQIIPSGLEILSLIYDSIETIDTICDFGQTVYLRDGFYNSHNLLRDTLVMLFQQAYIPFCLWADHWLGLSCGTPQTIFKNASTLDFDPNSMIADSFATHDFYDEFFISADDENKKTDFQACLNFKVCSGTRRPPSFISDQTAKTFLEAGISLRIIKTCKFQYPAIGSILNNSEEALHSTAAFFEHDINVIQDTIYQYESMQIQAWNEHVRIRNEAEQQKLAFKHRSQKQRTQSMNADIQRKSSVREEKLVLATLKKQQFKQDIDSYLADQKAFRLNMLKKKQYEEAERLRKQFIERAKIDQLEAKETDAILSEFKARMRMLEKKEARLVWRQQRLDLSIKRREAIEAVWEADDAVLPTSKADDHADLPFTDNTPEINSSNDVPCVSVDAIDVLPILEDTRLALNQESESIHEATQYPMQASVSADSSILLEDAICTLSPVNDAGIEDPACAHSINPTVMTDTHDTVHAAKHISQPRSISIHSSHSIAHIHDEDFLQAHNQHIQADDLGSLHSEVVSKRVSQAIRPVMSFESLVLDGLQSCSTFFNLPISFQPSPMKPSKPTIESEHRFSAGPLAVCMDRSLFSIWRTQEQIISRTAMMTFFCEQAHMHQDIRFHVKTLMSHYFLQDGQFLVSIKNALFGSSSFNMDYRTGLCLNGLGRWPVDKMSFDRTLGKIPFYALSHSGLLNDQLADSVLKFEYLSMEFDAEITGKDSLSFFKLVYFPPTPICTIMTDECAHDLNRVFSWLLKLTRATTSLDQIIQTQAWQKCRMSSSHTTCTDSELSLTEQKLTVQLVHHMRVFLNTIAWYSFEGVVRPVSVELLEILDATAELIRQPLIKSYPVSNGTYAETGYRYSSTTSSESQTTRQPICSLFKLGSIIRKAIYNINVYLFLSPQHRMIRTHLDYIIELILKFSRLMHGYPMPDSLPSLQAAFQVRLRLLINALRDLTLHQTPKSTLTLEHGRKKQKDSKRLMELASDLLIMLSPI